MYRRIGFLGCTLFFSWAFFLLPAMAQEGMPSGWQNLDAAAFLNQATPLLAGGANEDQRSVLVDHAWQRFLNDESFVAKSDWATVEGMVQGFSLSKRERATQGRSVAEIDAQAVTLADRLVARHATEGGLGSVEGLFTDMIPLVNYPRGILNKKKLGTLRAKWGELRAESGDWKSLTLQQQVELVGSLSQDQVSRSHMGARWTGSIKAPRNGSYTFYLPPGGALKPKYQLWIDDDLVLDSTTQNRAATQLFVSKPVSLEKGNPVSIRLEVSDLLVLTVSAGRPARYGWLAAGLLWKPTKDSGSPQLVPSAALIPPEDFETESSSGLKGEYFKEKGMSTLVAERLDSSLEFLWSGAPVVPVNKEKYSEVLEHCVGSLMRGNGRIGTASATDRHNFVIDTYLPLLDLLPISTRADLLERLISRKRLLSATSTATMARLIKSTRYLPGDSHLDLLIAWSQLRPQPRFQPGNPRVGMKKDLKAIKSGPTEVPFASNWSYFRAMGRHLQGDIETLINEHLERPDGECNLPVAYICAFAPSSQSRQLIDRLDTKLAEKSLVGDQRVTWLIARSFAAEVAITRKPLLLRGKEYLQEASLVAESKDYKFWALQEMMARYSALGDQAHLEPMLARQKGRFSEADQVEMMNACESMCNMHTQSRQINQKRMRNVNRENYIRDLRVRIKTVSERGDAAAVARFQKLLEKAIAAQER